MGKYMIIGYLAPLGVLDGRNSRIIAQNKDISNSSFQCTASCSLSFGLCNIMLGGVEEEEK